MNVDATFYVDNHKNAVGIHYMEKLALKSS